MPASQRDRARLFGHLAAVLRAMVYGTGVTALVQGALVAIGFAIVGLPSPMVFGVLAALAALIPLVGTPVVWVPAPSCSQRRAAGTRRCSWRCGAASS